MARGKKNEKELTIEERLEQALVPVEEQPYSVPENWCWVRGAFLFKPMESKSPVGTVFRYIDIDSIDNKTQRIHQPKVLLVKNAPSRANRKVHDGDTIFSLVRPYLRNIAYVDESLSDCIASTGFYICTPVRGLDSHYLFYLMQSEYVISGLTCYMKGDNSPSIRKSDLEFFAYPLPPFDEQQRIVDRIESLFAKLDEAKEKAQAVVDGFEARRAAILHKAYTGELTEKWRERHTEKVSPWGRKRIIDFATVVSGYAFNSRDFSEKNTVPCVKITNVGVGNYCEEEHEYLPQEFISKYNKFIVQENDLLISLTRSYISNGLKVCIYPFNRRALLNQRVALIRECNIPYLYYYFCTNEALNYVKSKSKTTNQPNLSIKDLCNLMVPFPLPDEQVEIVRILDILITKEQQAKEAAEAVLDQIEAMKKSILARAFRGKLGTNDPTDEGAVELLKQIL